MDLPITVIIVLFVALIVGGGVLLFAQTALTKSQQQLSDEFRSDPANKDVVIEVTLADPATMQKLANACLRKSMESATVERTICFAVFANSFPNLQSLNGLALENPSYTIDTSGVTGTPTAVRILYDPGYKILMTT